MFRCVRVLVALVVGLAVVALPGSAQAAQIRCDQGSRHWITPYAATGYGPIARYTEVVTTPVGKTGRAGFYSPLTGAFNPETGWLTVNSSGWFASAVPAVGSSTFLPTTGYASLNTAYGPTVWATQFTSNYGQARWGTWNLIANRFYPSSGWMATTGIC